MLWALLQFLIITRIPVRSEGISDSTGLVNGSNDEATTRRLVEIYTAIYEGAESFLRAEYSICARFIVVFGILIFVLVSWGTGWDFARGLFTTLSFVLGAATSIRECSLLSVRFRFSVVPILNSMFVRYISPNLLLLLLFLMKQPVIHHHHNNNSVWLPWNEGSRIFQRQDYRERSKVWMDCLFQHCLPVSTDILSLEF